MQAACFSDLALAACVVVIHITPIDCSIDKPKELMLIDKAAQLLL